MTKPNKTVATITEKDIATADGDSLRNLIHFFHGKPDSDYEVFGRQVLVNMQSLADLNENILSKIENHESQTICKVSISLSENKIKEFSSWDAFYNSDWRVHYTTKNISITWDFFINLPEFAAPQRHSLNVKIVSVSSGDEFLPALLLSGNPEKFDDLKKVGTVVARVDFINHRLGQELLNIVRDWNKRLPSCETFYDKLLYAVNNTESFTVYSVMIGFVLAYAAVITFFIESNLYSKDPLIAVSAIILVGTVLIYAARDVGEAIHMRINRILRKHRLPRIDLTAGDTQKIAEKRAKQNGSIFKALFHESLGLIMSGAAVTVIKYF